MKATNPLLAHSIAIVIEAKIVAGGGTRTFNEVPDPNNPGKIIWLVRYQNNLFVRALMDPSEDTNFDASTITMFGRGN